MAARQPAERIDRVEDDVVTLRERLTRVETAMEAHEVAPGTRHREMVALVAEIKARQEQMDERAWKLTMALLGIGMLGGAGAGEWIRALL